MARVLCAMSGGVDSSVAAAVLRRAGHDVIGVFLRLGSGADGRSGDETGGTLRQNPRACCSVNDARDAARVADRLDIPFYPLNYSREFGRIVDYFVDEYNRGRTPNPCARCNQWIKFGTLLEQATELDCDLIATGHYARVRHAGNGAELRRGADGEKDQSYFLFTMPRESLGRTLFPVGGMTKSECRGLARELGLPVADKRDSQEICFVPGGDYRAVLESRTPELIAPGPLLDPAGNVVGDHGGHQHFTIGQRRGLGRGFGEPRYVVGIDPARNAVVIGPRELLSRREFEVEETNWVSVEPPADGAEIICDVQIRHRAPAVPALVTVDGDGGARVRFETPQDAVTPGQAAVFYQGDTLLGGGWIA